MAFDDGAFFNADFDRCAKDLSKILNDLYESLNSKNHLKARAIAVTTSSEVLENFKRQKSLY